MNRTIFSSISLVFALAAMASCGQKKQPLPGKINELSWMLGRWESKSAEGLLSETWTKLNDSTFTGESYFEIGSDTVFSEQIRLEEHLKGISYIPVVADQNDGKPVVFKLIHSSKNKAAFENKTHDFPQKISYILRADSLTAEISGMEKGAKKNEQFVMKRSD